MVDIRSSLFRKIFPHTIKSDERISTIYRLNKPSDYLTPDMVEIDHLRKSVHVLELKTCYYNDQMLGKKQEIFDLYENECRVRSDKIGYVLKFSYVVVSRDKTNSNLSNISSELHSLYDWCAKIKSLCVQSGWTYDLDNGFSEDQKQLLSNISLLDIPLTSNDPAIISQESLDHWNDQTRKDCYLTSRALFAVNTKKSYDRMIAKAQKLNDREKVVEDYDLKCLQQARQYWKSHDDHFNTSRNDTKSAVQFPMSLQVNNGSCTADFVSFLEVLK
jgi:hypothetical protein